MAKSGFRVTSSPELATLLQIHNTGDEDTTVDVWPPIPIIIVDYELKASGVDGICAAHEHNDRVHEDAIRNSQSEKSCLQGTTPTSFNCP